MSAYFGFVFTGAEDLERSLRSLPDFIENNIAKQAYSSATRIYRKHITQIIRRQVKKRTGNLLKGVRHQETKIQGRVGAFRVYMGPPAYHAHLVERGTKQRKLKKRIPVLFVSGTAKRVSSMGWAMVTQTGRMPAKPFFWAGVKSATPEAMEKYKVEASRKMSAWAKKQRKKAGV